MKTTGLLLVFTAVLFTANCTFSQTENPSAYLKSLPAIELDKSQAASYRMITDYCDFDPYGTFRGKNRIAGDLTYKNDSVQWKNVHVSRSNSLDAEFPQGSRLSYMDNFKYKEGAEILPADFFRENLPEADPLTMNLVWDVMGFHVFAYDYWNSLKLNEEFKAADINSELEIAIGTFENRDIRLTWLGVTEMNGELCAILKYSVLNNPLDVEYEHIAMRGRSHYWGEVYVSLSDKQIEYANLTEDILTEMKIKGQENHTTGYTVRYITLSKIN